MNDFEKFFVAFFVFVVASNASPLSSVGLAGRDYLKITPGRTQVKAVGSRLVLTCVLTSSSDSFLTSPDDEVLQLRWKGPVSNYITNTKGRVYTERVDEKRLRLYITSVMEEDAGSYSCEANVNGSFLTARSHLDLFDDIRFLNATSSKVQEHTGADVFLQCEAEGKPEPEISWRFRGRKLVSDEDGGGDKYVYEKTGLWIHNVTKEDNGTYECRAQVSTQGNLKVRYVSLNVLYPPTWVFPIQNPLAIRGSDVTLECLADGNPPVTYRWFKEKITSNGVSEDRLKIVDYADMEDVSANGNSEGKFKMRAIDVEDEGKYHCRVANELGTLTAVYDVKVLVPPMVTAPKQLSVVEGKSIALSCEAVGKPLPLLSWKRKGPASTQEGIPLKNDKDISVDETNDGKIRLVIRNADSKRHNGNYTCTANNSAGFDSKDIDVTVETAPVATVSDSELVGWKGERRQVTCHATGVPLPTVAWLHNGLHVDTNDVTEVTVIKDAENVTSVLEIDLKEDDLDPLFGEYSCVAKNIHGYSTKVLELRRAFAPEAPRNVTVTMATQESISLSVEAAAASTVPDSVALPLTRWILRYEKTSDTGTSEKTINLLYEKGSSIVVGNLDPNTAYTMSLSAANAAGVGPSVKFQAKTLPALGNDDLLHKHSVHEEESEDFQGDDSRSMVNGVGRGIGEGGGGDEGGGRGGGESIAMGDKDAAIEGRGVLAEWGGISIGLIIGVGVMMAILVVTVSGAIVRTQRTATARRTVIAVVKGKTENGGVTKTTTTTTTTAAIKVSDCRDIDSLKVESNRPKTSVGPIPAWSLGPKRGGGGGVGAMATTPLQGSGSGSGSSAPVVMMMMVARPSGTEGSEEEEEEEDTGAPRSVVGVGDGTTGGSSAQSQAWKNMLLKAEADARDEKLLQQLEAEADVGEFPHPPLEMLLCRGTTEIEGGQTKMEVEEEEVEDVVGTMDMETANGENLSLNSDDECFQKVPQFEGKSFLQY